MTCRLLILTLSFTPWITGCKNQQHSDMTMQTGVMANAVTREYPKSSEAAWRAACEGIRSLDMQISCTMHHDALGGQFVAKRGNGANVTVSVDAAGEERSRILIHVAPGDAMLAELIHLRIAEKMGIAEARRDSMGANELMQVYPMNVELCLQAARRAYRSLDIAVVQDEKRNDYVRFDGRLMEQTPVRIRMRSIHDAQTEVTFLVGLSGNDENKALLARVKKAFEQALNQPTTTP